MNRATGNSTVVFWQCHSPEYHQTDRVKRQEQNEGDLAMIDSWDQGPGGGQLSHSGYADESRWGYMRDCLPPWVRYFYQNGDEKILPPAMFKHSAVPVWPPNIYNIYISLSNQNVARIKKQTHRGEVSLKTFEHHHIWKLPMNCLLPSFFLSKFN